MDAMAIHANEDPFGANNMSNEDDNLLSNVWDWCAIKGCRAICLSGNLFMKKGAWNKFR